jgi:signal transduction histidine kinase
MKLPASRLFWKLSMAFWLAVLLSFAFGYFFLMTVGVPPPHEQPQWLPLVPIVSGAVASLLFGFGLAWYLLRPLRHLERALRETAGARFDVRVLPLLGSRRDEIVDLAREFDGMAARLQQANAQQQRLFHDVSHELRSPLARMQAAIGLMRQSPSQAPALLERIERESGRLDALIEELLTLHRLEAGAANLVRERVDVIELLRDIAVDADFEAQAASRSVSLDAPGAFVTEVNGELIYRAIENVVRNAVKFTAPATAVEIVARTSADGATLAVTVQDRGPGVPPNMLEAIFEPFIRVDGGKGVRGAGLGLAIARRALAMHGGRLSASLREGGGLLISMSLPAQ